MNTKIKYLDFKGVEKKEQILFKSYLNLAKNELDYQLVVLSNKQSRDDAPDILIIDSEYEFLEAEQELKALPTIEVGSDVELEQENYISRPVQWSDFKRALASLNFEEDQVADQEVKRLLPDEMRFAIAEMDERTVSVISDESSEPVDYADEYDYELGSMSVDYHSFTNSDYVKVVEDVQGFHDEANDDGSGSAAPVVLVTNEESTSVNSVLVIETDSMDVWDMEAFADEEPDEESSDPEETVSENEVEEARRQAIFKKLESGEVVSIKDEYWTVAGEIYCDADPLFIISPDQEMIYSAKEPAKWGISMRNREFVRLPLPRDWSRDTRLKGYPLSRLLWANSFAANYQRLVDGVELEQMYMLERWPHFDVLELDNMLLKLCTMMFIGPESPQSLMKKTGYSRSVVYALVNACYESGILKHEDDIEKQNLAQIKQQEEGMLDRIKDVFR